MSALSDSERLAWLRLARSDGIGPQTFHKLIARYKTASRALEALPELATKGGAKRGLKVYASELAQKEIDATAKAGAQLLFSCESQYPTMLRNIDSAPPILCVSGNLPLFQKTSVAIVGARTASASGRKMARIMAHALAEEGFLVTSGLARGIDTSAHEAATPARTAAVIAGVISI